MLLVEHDRSRTGSWAGSAKEHPVLPAGCRNCGRGIVLSLHTLRHPPSFRVFGFSTITVEFGPGAGMQDREELVCLTESSTAITLLF